MWIKSAFSVVVDHKDYIDRFIFPETHRNINLKSPMGFLLSVAVRQKRPEMEGCDFPAFCGAGRSFSNAFRKPQN